MKTFSIFNFIILLLVTACNSSKKESSSLFSGPPAPKPFIEYAPGTSSPSDDVSPTFLVYKSPTNLFGWNSGSGLNIYAGQNCEALVSSLSFQGYNANIGFYVDIPAPGTYYFTFTWSDAFLGQSACSSSIKYVLVAPTAPTSIDLLSQASPSMNANPRIRVNGLGSHGTEVYLNNTCSGPAFSSSTLPIFHLQPLPVGIHGLYAKTVTSTGIKSVCSAKLLDYQSLYNFTLNLSSTSIAFGPTTSSFYSTIESDDIDGDGIDDYAYTTQLYGGVYYGSGGSFVAPRTLVAASGGGTTKIADMTGDGKKDVLLTDGSQNIHLFTNNGNRTFTKTTILAFGSNGLATIPQIDAADFNGDGNMDIVFRSSHLGDTFVALSNGNGTFQTRYVAYHANTDTHNFFINDMDNDGDTDIIEYANNLIKIHNNNGSGVFTLGSTITNPLGTYTLVEIGKMDGDNFPDIAVVDGTSAKVMINDMVGGFGTVNSLTLLNSISDDKSMLKDFNGDGFLDIIVSQYAGKYVSVILGNGDGTLDLPLLYNINGPSAFTIMDHDNDGKNDIVGKIVIRQN